MSRLYFHISRAISITFFSLLASIIFTTVVSPTDRVPTSILWQQVVVGVAGSLSCLIYPWNRGMSKRETVIRTVIHYLIVLAMVLGFGSLFGWFDIRNVFQTVIMAVMITLIYGIIAFFPFKKQFDETDKLNEGLRKTGEEK